MYICTGGGGGGKGVLLSFWAIYGWPDGSAYIS